MAAIRNKTKKHDKNKEMFLENLTINEAKRKMQEIKKSLKNVIKIGSEKRSYEQNLLFEITSRSKDGYHKK